MSNRFVTIRHVRVDVDALLSLSHTCNPSKCVHAKTCCSSYDVPVTGKEEETITGLLPDAAKYARHLRDVDEIDDIFDEDGRDTSLQTHESGMCLFAYRGRDKGVRCSLHSAALDLGLAPEKSKPGPCSLWPLAIAGGRPATLTIMEDALGFPCNRRRNRGPIHKGVQSIIASTYGKPFLAELNKAVAERTGDDA